MKTKIILYYSYVILCVLLFTECNRCKDGSGNVTTMNRNVTSFSSVKIEGGLTVSIKNDSVSKVEVITDDNIQPYILTYVNGNTLTVETNYRKCIKKSTMMHINISAPLYEKIELRGSGNVMGSDTIKGDQMRIVLDGSGNISLTAAANDLNAKINGSGHLELYGTANSMTETINGSGSIEGFGFAANTAHAHISGSGLIETNAVSSLNATIKGSGNISYSGNPVVKSNVDGSGSVSRR
jgi:hypothetical protein